MTDLLMGLRAAWPHVFPRPGFAAGPLGLGQRSSGAQACNEPVQLLSRQLGVEIFRLERGVRKRPAGSTPRSSRKGAGAGGTG